MYFSATASKIVPMFLAAVVLFSAVMAESSDEGGSIYTACNVGKYSNGSQFDTNLEALFKSLTENAAYAGFGASVYGQDTSDQLSGRLQCSPHLSPADCRTCLAEAVNAVRRDCPNAIGARVQLERCFLRYENYTFLTVLDTNLWYSVANVTKETDIHFDAALRGVLADLSSRAPASPLKFALGSSAVVSSTWNVSIYAMEMCWRDMSREDCAACLTKGIEEVFILSSQRVGAQVFMGSCTLRYEIYPFAQHYY